MSYVSRFTHSINNLHCTCYSNHDFEFEWHDDETSPQSQRVNVIINHLFTAIFALISLILISNFFFNDFFICWWVSFYNIPVLRKIIINHLCIVYCKDLRLILLGITWITSIIYWGRKVSSLNSIRNLNYFTRYNFLPLLIDVTKKEESNDGENAVWH